MNLSKSTGGRAVIFSSPLDDCRDRHVGEIKQKVGSGGSLLKAGYIEGTNQVKVLIWRLLQ